MSLTTKAQRGGDPPALELELERNGSAPLLARAAIVGFCQDSGVSPDAIPTVTLLVSEVVTNAVVHPELDPPGKIGLYARLERKAIRVEVTDNGHGFTAALPDPGPLGGYGLFLLDKESTRWGVRAAPHTTVWFEVAN